MLLPASDVEFAQRHFASKLSFSRRGLFFKASLFLSSGGEGRTRVRRRGEKVERITQLAIGGRREGQEGLSSPFLQIQKFSFSRHLKEEALPFLPESIGPCGKAKVFLSSTFSQASPLFSRSKLRFLLLLLLETTFRFWARPEKRGSRAFSQPL